MTTQLSLPQLNLAPSVRPRHRRALEELASLLQKELKGRLVGILIGGSVGRGSGEATSDVDVFVLVDADWHQRRRLTIAGVAFDIFLDPPHRALNRIATEKAAVRIENYACGWIAFDPEGHVRRLAARAKEIYERGRGTLTPTELTALHSCCADLAATAKHAASSDDRLSFDYVCSMLVVHLTDAYYLAFAKWDPPPKRRMNRLSEQDPAFCDTLRVLMDSSAPAQERVAAATAMIAKVFGDDLAGRENWSSKRVLVRGS